MEQTALASVRKVKYRSCLTVTPRRTTGRMHVRSGPKQGMMASKRREPRSSS